MRRGLVAYCSLIAIVLLATSSGFLSAQTAAAPAVSPEMRQAFAAYLAAHDQPPDDYVVGKFRDHDIVFLGEQHHVAQYLDFAGHLVPKLYAAGVYNMGWEFTDSEDQPALDRVINAATWDEQGAEQVLWKCYNLAWVSTGYRDIIHAVWQFNHDLKPGARRFRLVGLNVQVRLVSRAQLLPGEVPTDHKVQARVLGRNSFDAMNLNWEEVIRHEFILKKERALIYCGSGHTWTRFFYQRGPDHGFTVANLVHDTLGEHTMRIVMHGALQGTKNRLDEDFTPAVASLMGDFNGGHRQAAFDIRGGPLADFLLPHVTGFLFGSDPSHRTTAGDVMDGYIYLGPMDDWRNDTFITSFINQKNFEELRERWELFTPRTPHANSIEELVAMVQKQFHYGPK